MASGDAGSNGTDAEIVLDDGLPGAAAGRRVRPFRKSTRTAEAAQADARNGRAGERGASLGELGLQQFAPYLMNRIMGRYNATLRDELREHGLTTPQMRILAILAVMDGLTINEVAVYSVIEQSTLSRTLDAMETQGLLRRETQSSDNRIRRIYLSDKGRALFDDVWPVMRSAFDTMFAGVGDGEYAAFVGVLQQVLRNVRQHDF